MIGNIISLFFLFFLTLSIPLSANAADISVTASVTKTKLSINDILEYKITISGAKTQPTINESFLNDFSIINRSTQQSYQLINNNFFSSQIKSFQLRPNIEGTIIIPSAKLTIDGKTFETDPITITVSANTSPSSTPNASPSKMPISKQGVSSSGIPQGSSKDLFILAVLDKNQAYVGEEIIYSVRLYRRFSAIDQLLYQEPKFGMLSEQLERDQKTYTQTYKGIRYYVQEIDRRSLFSYESGSIAIPPASAEVQINFFYGSQIIQSNEISINIIPLPETNKPSDFSGLVGDYGLDVDVNTKALVENKPIAIRLSVGGSGNLKQLSTLSISTDSDIFKVYQSSINDLITYVNSVKGIRHFEYIMVPKVDGSLSLPVFSFSYFDPKTKQYNVLSSPSQTVSIIDAGESEIQFANNDSQNLITELRQDLRYIKESIDISKQATPFFKQVFSLFLIALNIGLLATTIFSFIAKSSLFRNIIQRFSLKPSKQAVNAIEQIKSTSDWSINDVQHHIFRFLSSILNRPVQGLPLSEIIEELTQQNIDTSTITDLESLLDQCSFLAYSPDSSNVESKIDICDKAIDIIKRIKT
tara:strand:+ start:226 stop:1983 length:1758 start_codon:yes stop_codon:yes gene_type:complete